MALVKLRPRKPKSTQEHRNDARGVSGATRRSKPAGIHFTTEMIFAEMAKLKPNSAAQPTPTPTPAPAPANATPSELDAKVPPPKTRRAKQRSDEPTVSASKRRRNVPREPVDLDRPGYLRLVDVLTVFPVSRAKWYQGIEKGIYPRSYPLGERAVGWRTADIKALIEAPPGKTSV